MFGTRILQQTVLLAETEYGNHDMFNLDQHIIETQFDTDNYYFDLIEMLVSKYYGISDKHILPMRTHLQ